MARFDNLHGRESGIGRHVLKAATGLTMAGALAACNATAPAHNAGSSAASVNPTALTVAPEAQPENYKLGSPYKIAGRWFHPEKEPGYDEVGSASWYGSDFHGRQTANGETYDMNALTAAHPTLPMPSYVRVTNLDNDQSVVVRINDRGPFANGRLIDLSRQTARLLDFKHNGTAQVRVQYLGLASAQGDDSWLTTTVRHDGDPVDSDMMAAADTSIAPASTEGSGTSQQSELSLALAANFAPSAEHNAVAATFALFDHGPASLSLSGGTPPSR